MNIEEKIIELEERIKRNKELLELLNEKALYGGAPQGFKGATSWQDYDCIRGSREELNPIQYAERRKTLETFIEIDEHILNNLYENKNIEDRFKYISNTKDRVKFLKDLGYNNTEIGNVLKITPRHVRRVIKNE